MLYKVHFIFIGSTCNIGFGQQTTYSTDPNSLLQSAYVGDFNKDGKLDIATANYGTSNIGIFFEHMFLMCIVI